MKDVTFIIKTLERPYCLNRLVKSIFKYYPDARILIGDDSEVSCKKMIEKRFPSKNITVYELPYDCGISYGRNFLVKKVETPFFVLLDDDFEFDKKTKIEYGLSILKEKGLDIGGGYFRNYHPIYTLLDLPKYFAKCLLRRIQDYNYLGFIDYNEQYGELKVRYHTKLFPEFKRVDIVHNFFIAKTDVIRERCLWDEEIKIHEHTPFFLKAKINGLSIGFIKEMSVKHKPIRAKKYNSYRDRNYVKEWMRLYKISRFVSTVDDGEERVQTL